MGDNASVPAISVIMPSYNHERFIREAIASVLSQSFQDLELIIIDDASADGSRRIIESCRAQDGRIRTFFHDTNQGLARTLNHGLEEARGRFAAFLASDDVWVAQKLKKQLDVLQGNNKLVVCSGMLVIDAEGKPGGEVKFTRGQPSGFAPGREVFRKLLAGNFIAGQSLIIQRENLNGIRFDDRLKYLNDWKFAMDLANRCDFYFLPECLVKYRLHGGNSVSRDAAGWLHDYALHGQYLLERYGDQIPRKWKATLMYRTGCDIHGRGDRHGGRKWMLKAIAAHPFKSEYYAGLLSSFCRREIMPRSLQRKAPSD